MFHFLLSRAICLQLTSAVGRGEAKAARGGVKAMWEELGKLNKVGHSAG